jgi:hypothetical protein
VNWFEGKKRYLLLLVFVVQAIAQLTQRGHDIVDVTRVLLFGLPPDAIATGLVVLQIVLALWAIHDGWLKDREARSRLHR